MRGQMVTSTRVHGKCQETGGDVGPEGDQAEMRQGETLDQRPARNGRGCLCVFCVFLRRMTGDPCWLYCRTQTAADRCRGRRLHARTLKMRTSCAAWKMGIGRRTWQSIREVHSKATATALTAMMRNRRAHATKFPL